MNLICHIKKNEFIFRVHSIILMNSKRPHRILQLTLLLFHSEYIQCMLDLQYNPLLLI